MTPSPSRPDHHANRGPAELIWKKEVNPSQRFWAAASAAPAAANKALQLMKQFGLEPLLTAEQLSLSLHHVNLKLEDYVPGSCHYFLGGWREFLKPLGNDQDAQEVLQWLEFGYKIEFAAPTSPLQWQRPGNAGKKETLLNLLKVPSGNNQHHLLAQKTPPQLHFPNFKSAETHASHIDAELKTMLEIGVVAEWKTEWKPPHQINPIGAVMKNGKCRFCAGPTADQLVREAPSFFL